LLFSEVVIVVYIDDDVCKCTGHDLFVYSVEQEALGRGINVVIVNSRTKSVIKMEHFDTYEFSKSQFSYLSI